MKTHHMIIDQTNINQIKSIIKIKNLRCSSLCLAIHTTLSLIRQLSIKSIIKFGNTNRISIDQTNINQIKSIIKLSYLRCFSRCLARHITLSLIRQLSKHPNKKIIQISGVPLSAWQVRSFRLLLHRLPLHRRALPHNRQVIHHFCFLTKLIPLF